MKRKNRKQKEQQQKEEKKEEMWMRFALRETMC